MRTIEHEAARKLRQPQRAEWGERARGGKG